MARISVIMSTFNEPISQIEKSINSILNQSIGFFEFVIVNDNPSRVDLKIYLDSIRAKDPRIHLIENSFNLGLVYSLNIALKNSSGDYIARMDADDISLPFRFEKELNFLINNNLDLVGGAITRIDESDKRISDFFYPSNHLKIAKNLLWNSSMAHPTWFGKKSVFEFLGGYNDIDSCEDYEFLIRAVKAGFKLGNLTDICLLYRVRLGGISKSNIVKQNLISYFLSLSFRNNVNDFIYSLKSYLCSEDYKRDFLRLSSYEENKRKYKITKSKLKRMYYILSFCGNIYFFKNILKKFFFVLYMH